MKRGLRGTCRLMGCKMKGEKILGIHETEEGRRIEISFERVVIWTLIFTNAFFVPYFFAKLFRWI
jgi:hypothetical protein